MIKLFKKDVLLFINDKRIVFLTFLLPIILISLFAFAFGGMGSDDRISDPFKLLATDLDSSEYSKGVIDQLDSLPEIEVIMMAFSEAKIQIGKGKFMGVLVLHEGMQDSVEAGAPLPFEIMYDKAKQVEIGMLQPYLMATLMPAIGKQRMAKSMDEFMQRNFPGADKEITANIIKDIETNSVDFDTHDREPEIKMTSIVGEKKDANLGLIQAVAGTAIMMLLFSVAGLGASILDEKESGTLNRLLYSPLTTNTILFGKLLYAFFIAIVQLSIMFTFAWLAFGLNLFANIPGLILMISSIAFAVSSFGIFLAAISKTRQQAQSLGTLIVLVMSAIGGSMVPLFVMPAIMKKIAVVSLNYWGIQGFYDIFWRGLGVSDILIRVAVLIGMGLVMTSISIPLFAKNIRRLG